LAKNFSRQAPYSHQLTHSLDLASALPKALSK